jgi:hypothetical protein
MAEPTNAEIMGELKKLGGIVRGMDRRLKTVEADRHPAFDAVADGRAS